MKRLLHNEFLMSQIHDYHLFRFSKVSGQVVIDVKELSTSEWVRLEGNLIGELSSSEIPHVSPDFQDVLSFEIAIDDFVKDNLMLPTQAAKLKAEIASLKSTEGVTTWNFEDFPKYFNRPSSQEIIQPLLANTVEEMFIPRPPLIRNQRTSFKKRHVFVADLLLYLENGLACVGTVKNISNGHVEIILWELINNEYQMTEGTRTIPRHKIMASGLRFNKVRTFDQDIQIKIQSLIEQHTSLNSQSSQELQSQYSTIDSEMLFQREDDQEEEEEAD